MPTAHIDALPDEIAPLVLFPGDPLRAQFIANKFLSGSVEVSTRRNMLAYTGTYRGVLVSVMGSGMGIPSCALYATELAREYGVRQIVRIGTCGGIGDVDLGDLLLAQSASTDSSFNRVQFGGYDLSACADFTLLRSVADTADAQGISVRVGGVFSTDCFYGNDPDQIQRLTHHRIQGVEMESAGLYGVAVREGIQALSVLTVSDHLERNTHMPAQERERGLPRMAALVLDSLVRPDKP